MDISSGSFIWDDKKEAENILKHNIDFKTASKAFFDTKRIIFKDSKHSKSEERLFCVGKVDNKIMTVRFTYRGSKVRIIGARYWKGGKKHYEE
jgi:uncharacterized DUF497 family protein